MPRKTNPEAETLIDKYFPVLDYGFVALKDYQGTDETIEMAARVSYGRGTKKKNTTGGLLRYLMRHHHSSPFELCNITVHMGMPIFVARQLVRTRTARMNEYSGRYSVMPTIFYLPQQNVIKKQSSKNKQGGSEELVFNAEDYDNWLNECLLVSRTNDVELYVDNINHGMSRELARIDLPLSTYTYMYWQLDLNNLFKTMRNRLDSHAQYEIREYFKVIAGVVKQCYPLAWQAFQDYILESVSFSRKELRVYSKLMQMHSWDNDEATKLLEEQGLSKGEIEEFFDKLRFEETPDYSLDLSLSRDASYYEELIKKKSFEEAPHE